MVFGLGLIPIILIVFGIYMMKKNNDFSHVETAIINVNRYIYTCVAVAICVSLYYAYESLVIDSSFSLGYGYGQMSAIAALVATIAGFYIVIIKKFFLLPLAAHAEWVEYNGIFSNKPRTASTKSKSSSVSMIKKDKEVLLSDADELIKWIKFKEDGHISEQEFQSVKEKILKKQP